MTAGGIFYGAFGPGFDVRLTNCIVWGNTGGQISGIGLVIIGQSDVQGGWPGDGNIDADPLFVDAPAGDLRLGPGSPCIDAGVNTVFLTAATPLGLGGDGSRLPRFVDDPETADTGLGTVPVIDLGAEERQPSPTCPGDSNGDGVVNVQDLLGLHSAWVPCPF